MSGPSEKAVEAAGTASRAFPPTMFGIGSSLGAAHDPALGRDRSVCLRDVVEALRGPHVNYEQAADFIEREFGGLSK